MPSEYPQIPILALGGWLSALTVLVLAYGFGSLLVIARTESPWFDSFLLRVALGFAILSVLVLWLGQIPGFIFQIRPLWIGLSVAFGVNLCLTLRRQIRGNPNAAASPPPKNPVERILEALGWLALASALILLLGPALSPPLAFDALEYHMGAVSHYFRSRGISPIPHVFYSAQPIATEMQYALAAIVEGIPWGTAPGILQWSLVALSVALLLRLSIAVGLPRSITPFVGILFLNHPIIVRLELDQMTDITGVMFLLAAWLYWIAESGYARGEGLRIRDALIMGILAGGAISSKWTNAGTAAMAIALLPAFCILRDIKFRKADESGGPPSRSLRVFASYFALGGALILIPWAAWIYKETGNPFAPFAASLFPTERWSPERQAFLLDTHGPLSILTLEFWTHLFGRLRSPQAATGAFTAAMILALTNFVLRRRSGDADAAASLDADPLSGLSFYPPAVAAGIAATFIGWILWGRLGDAAIRFLAPLVALQFVLLAVTLSAIIPRLGPRLGPRLSPLFRIGAQLFLVLWIGFQFLAGQATVVAGHTDFWNQALGKTSAKEFLSSQLGATADLFFAANDLPKGSRILAVGEARGYYIRPAITVSTAFDLHPLHGYLQDCPDAAELGRRLAADGYTHLLVNEFETARLLDFHFPPVLNDDSAFQSFRTEKNYPKMAELYWGYSEFGTDPLTPAQREVYGEFLRQLRAQPTYRARPGGEYPDMWIAELAPAPSQAAPSQAMP